MTLLMRDRTALNEVIESAHEIKQWERKVNDLSLKIAETPEGGRAPDTAEPRLGGNARVHGHLGGG